MASPVDHRLELGSRWWDGHSGRLQVLTLNPSLAQPHGAQGTSHPHQGWPRAVSSVAEPALGVKGQPEQEDASSGRLESLPEPQRDTMGA